MKKKKFVHKHPCVFMCLIHIFLRACQEVGFPVRWFHTDTTMRNNLCNEVHGGECFAWNNGCLSVSSSSSLPILDLYRQGQVCSVRLDTGGQFPRHGLILALD
ncbi:hypothetical protein AALO_G00152250 [Alosa alosa]|uniref:Secreted protein n=1 Tax=Alosa alosa TaxID=278164 RepID=A0AAV6GEC7_9TELE|nr:hypothetical protein AALO_G00152250 [Alosa alosa]